MSRIRRALRELASPRSLVLMLRMLAWAAVLPVAKRLMPLRALIRLMAGGAQSGQRDAATEARIVRVSRILYRSRAVAGRDNCLERSLVTYRYLARAGAAPELVIGFKRAEQDYVGHVWVTLDGQPVHDDPRSLGELVQIERFGSGGLPSPFTGRQGGERGGGP